MIMHTVSSVTVLANLNQTSLHQSLYRLMGDVGDLQIIKHQDRYEKIVCQIFNCESSSSTIYNVCLSVCLFVCLSVCLSQKLKFIC